MCVYFSSFRLNFLKYNSSSSLIFLYFISCAFNIVPCPSFRSFQLDQCVWFHLWFLYFLLLSLSHHKFLIFYYAVACLVWQQQNIKQMNKIKKNLTKKLDAHFNDVVVTSRKIWLLFLNWLTNKQENCQVFLIFCLFWLDDSTIHASDLRLKWDWKHKAAQKQEKIHINKLLNINLKNEGWKTK